MLLRCILTLRSTTKSQDFCELLSSTNSSCHGKQVTQVRQPGRTVRPRTQIQKQRAADKALPVRPEERLSQSPGGPKAFFQTPADAISSQCMEQHGANYSELCETVLAVGPTCCIASSSSSSAYPACFLHRLSLPPARKCPADLSVSTSSCAAFPRHAAPAWQCWCIAWRAEDQTGTHNTMSRSVHEYCFRDDR